MPSPKDRRSSAPPARRRAAVLAGHQTHTDAAVALSEDPDPSVRAAALGALARLGELGTHRLLRALTDPDATVRRRACGIAGRIASGEAGPSPGALLEVLTGALSDPDFSVAETAAWALGEWGAASAGVPVEVLCRTAREHPDTLCREAAVASLGAIGDERALPAVLAALEDRPAVRRRAAIALAAFEDPTAEEGLRRCLQDRDWQVRQVAEELLDDQGDHIRGEQDGA